MHILIIMRLIFTLLRTDSRLGIYINSAEPARITLNAASDQGPHSLSTGISVQNDKDGHVHWSKRGCTY